MSDRVSLGRVGRPHGVSGAFLVWPYADDLERFSRLRHIVLTHRDKSLEATVESVRLAKGHVVIQTGQLATPEDVRPWTGGDLEVDASERIQLPPGRYFHDQIIGLKVITVTGEQVGVIESIMDGPANDVYVCRDGTKEHLIPAVETIVKEIDLTAGAMKIDPIPGLLDS
jgi:16S rRNA processing protein RimM